MDASSIHTYWEICEELNTDGVEMRKKVLLHEDKSEGDADWWAGFSVGCNSKTPPTRQDPLVNFHTHTALM